MNSFSLVWYIASGFAESIIRLKTDELRSPGKVGIWLKAGLPGSAMTIVFSVTMATVCLKKEISVAYPGIVQVAKCRKASLVS